MKNKKFKIDPISLFSHELKTPLSSLKMGLELMEKDFEKHKDMLPLMKEELERMINFIRDNLDLRFIQKKKNVLEQEWRSFDSLVSQVCSSLNWMAQREAVSFQVQKTNPHPVELFMDVSWLRRLMENLLVNALHFAPKNTNIFIEYGLDKKGQFVCSVRDEGPGFSSAEKVFDPFYTNSSAKKDFKSTGLGLSIARSIVEIHGGGIFARPGGSKPGAVFYFTLPSARLLKKAS